MKTFRKGYIRINRPKSSKDCDITMQGVQPLCWLSEYMTTHILPQNFLNYLIFGRGGVYCISDKELKEKINEYLPHTLLLED